jgi:hypothetical protein
VKTDQDPGAGPDPQEIHISGGPPSATSASPCEEIASDPAAPGPAWATGAGDLADWAMRNVVARTDAFGGYYATRQPDGTTKFHTTTRKGKLSHDVLIKHFAGTVTDGRVGVHVVNPVDSTCRTVVVDIDAHSGKDDPDRNRVFALKVARDAISRGVEVLVFDSNGAGGYHIWCLLGEPVTSAIACGFGKWLKRDWKKAGFATAPESFPKSEELSGKGYGGWVRLPGRHHKRPHWTRVWDGQSDELATGMLTDEAAVRKILASGVSPAVDRGRFPLVPEEWAAAERRRVAPGPRKIIDPATLGVEAARVRGALGALGPAYHDDYDRWLRVGMALRNLGDEGLALWHEWSTRSAKYHPEVLDGKWATFADPDDPRHWGRDMLSLGTIYRMANGEGWTLPFKAASTRRGQGRRRRFTIDFRRKGR